MVVTLEDQGNIPTVIRDTGFDKTQGSGIRITTRFDGQLEMVARIISGRIWSKAARRAMLEALIDRQNNHLSRAAQAAMIEHAGQVCTHTSILAGVPA